MADNPFAQQGSRVIDPMWPSGGPTGPQGGGIAWWDPNNMPKLEPIPGEGPQMPPIWQGGSVAGGALGGINWGDLMRRVPGGMGRGRRFDWMRGQMPPGGPGTSTGRPLPPSTIGKGPIFGGPPIGGGGGWIPGKPDVFGPPTTTDPGGYPGGGGIFGGPAFDELMKQIQQKYQNGDIKTGMALM